MSASSLSSPTPSTTAAIVDRRLRQGRRGVAFQTRACAPDFGIKELRALEQAPRVCTSRDLARFEGDRRPSFTLRERGGRTTRPVRRSPRSVTVPAPDTTDDTDDRRCTCRLVILEEPGALMPFNERVACPRFRTFGEQEPYNPAGAPPRDLAAYMEVLGKTRALQDEVGRGTMGPVGPTTVTAGPGQARSGLAGWPRIPTPDQAPRGGRARPGPTGRPWSAMGTTTVRNHAHAAQAMDRSADRRASSARDSARRRR